MKESKSKRMLSQRWMQTDSPIDQNAAPFLEQNRLRIDDFAIKA
jgi:hypothetical protein